MERGRSLGAVNPVFGRSNTRIAESLTYTGRDQRYNDPPLLIELDELVFECGSRCFPRVWSTSRRIAIRFTGERWEAYSQLLFLRARYYEPEMGRFVSKDAWEGDFYQPQTLLGNYV